MNEDGDGSCGSAFPAVGEGVGEGVDAGKAGVWAIVNSLIGVDDDTFAVLPLSEGGEGEGVVVGIAVVLQDGNVDALIGNDTHGVVHGDGQGIGHGGMDGDGVIVGGVADDGKGGYNIAFGGRGDGDGEVAFFTCGHIKGGGAYGDTF